MIKNAPNKTGFTLIELSIVIVIIGMIAGLITVGQSMIKAATIQAQVAQISDYISAARLFEKKYGYLPGDIPATPASQLGLITRTVATNHGDGNGQIVEGCGTGLGTGDLGCENALFWTDLSSTTLIADRFTAATDAAVTAAAGVVGNFLPQGKIKGNYLLPRWSGTFNYLELMGITSYSGGTSTLVKAITPQDAYSMDYKIDDGLPLTGSVLSPEAAAAPAAGVCASNASTPNPYNTTTSTFANSNACYMQFKF